MHYLVDLRDEFKKKNMSPFSELLQEKIKETLAKKEQIILFLNKRGSASCLFCRSCGEYMFCNACDVTLTYHKPKYAQRSNYQSFLMCHYCGRIEKTPEACPACDSPHIYPLGSGTQKIEEEARKLFPGANIARLDRDTTSQKHVHEDTYHAFKRQEIDILIGTQIIGKGLDIPNVGLIGIMLADVGLHVPDFRSTERLYQTLTQVAGRTSRRGKEGDVVIQTYTPGTIHKHLAKEDYFPEFYKDQIQEREEFFYPPFSKIIKLTYVHHDKKKALGEVKKLYQHFQKLQEMGICKDAHLTYAPALIPKMHNKYHINIYIRGQEPRTLLKEVQLREPWRIDVDPLQ